MTAPEWMIAAGALLLSVMLFWLAVLACCYSGWQAVIVHAMKQGADTVCGERGIYSGVPRFITCEACKGAGLPPAAASSDRIASAV